METILDALKAMKKASAREIAARLDIEPQDALSMLREQKERGLCDFADGGWFLGTAKNQKPKRVREKTTSPLVGEILAVMEGEGAMSTLQIAQKTGRNARALNASLGAMSKNGQVTRHVDRKNITWSVSGQGAASPVDSVPETAAPTGSPVQAGPVPDVAAKTTAEIVQDIPAFTARADDLIVPSARFISGEIRRTKAKLGRLQKLQSAMRELRRHKGILMSLTREAS